MSEKFVEARKRRRRAIDPSIGYYIYSQCADGLKGTVNGEMAVSSRESISIPISDRASVCSGLPCLPKARAHHSTSSAEQPENLMTVERFLRQGGSKRQKNSEAPLFNGPAPTSCFLDQPTVNSLKLRSRTVVRNRSPKPDSSSECSDSEVPLSERQKRIPRQGHRQKRAFKERIYQAAIASGVDPINILVQPKDTPISKVPLSFQPVSPPQLRRNRGSILAPNRKDNPFQDSRFSRALDPSKSKAPLSRWHNTLPNLSKMRHRETETEGMSTQGGGENALTSYPLHFVPLLQAEEGYTAMFVRAQQ